MLKKGNQKYMKKMQAGAGERGLQKDGDEGIIGWEKDGKAGKRMERLRRGWKGWEEDGKAGKRMERAEKRLERLGRGWKGWEEDGEAEKRMERMGREWRG